MKKINHKKINKNITKASGNVKLKGALTCFFYLLMRDKNICTGELEEIVRKAETYKDNKYSNGWLALYAQNLAKRLQ